MFSLKPSRHISTLPKPVISRCLHHVHYPPNSGAKADIPALQLGANRVRWHCSKCYWSGHPHESQIEAVIDLALDPFGVFTEHLVDQSGEWPI